MVPKLLRLKRKYVKEWSKAEHQMALVDSNVMSKEKLLAPVFEH